MDLDGGFWVFVAIGFVLYIFEFRSQRNPGVLTRRLMINRVMASMAGSRSTWVSCYDLAMQVGAISLPVWHLLLRNIPASNQNLFCSFSVP